MGPGDLWDTLSPHARVATAVVPFVFAMGARLMFGKGRVTGWLITVGVLWFAMNIMMAPYSSQMRHDIRNLRYVLR